MKQIYMLLLAFLASSFSFGQVNYLNDGFNYTNGDLLTNNGWTAHSGVGNQSIDVGTSNGLLYAGYNDGASSITGLTPGNAANLDNTGEDVNKAFTTVPATGSTIYYSFLLNVTNANAGNFIHLSPTSTATQVGRVYVKPSSIDAANKFNIGISNTTTAVYATTPTELNLNTTYLVIVKYDNSSTGAMSLWIKSSGIPASETAAGPAEVSTTSSGNASIDRICLRQFNASQNETVDALYVSSTWLGTAPCNLALQTEVATCDAVTLAIDTYTITVPFTGGNSGTYNLSSSTGTISGDNPNTTASGNITISNIPEGTDVTLTITGTCGLTKYITAPQCRPVNTMPYSESFNYSAGTILSSTQKWTVANTGDDILVASGNLSYAGITSTGNSINFVGGGAESRSPFTPTTSGNIYGSFIINISDLSTIVNDLTDVTYFALFNDGGAGSSNARIWHRRNGTQSQFGLSTDSTPANVVWSPNLHTPGTSVYLSLGYNFTDHTVTLVENPTIGGPSAPSVSVTLTSAISTIGGFMFRQDSANTTPAMTIDELRVDTTPDYTLSAVSFNNIADLNVYPNPANDILHITTAVNGIKTVAIYDLVGKQVLNTTTNNEAINVSSLNKGVYMLKITEEGKTATRKLVIK